MEWGICTTAKAPLPQLLAFVAWHKHIGAAQIWIHLDDADEVTADVLNRIEGVTAIVCDDAYWSGVKGGRPEAHQTRQTYNVRKIYKRNAVPVLAHIDVDEYLYPQRPISEILDDWDDDIPFIRAAPAEALYDPDLPDDIFTARHFRLPFPHGVDADTRIKVLGDYEILMPHNILSHRVGKSLFRSGVPDLKLSIHSAKVGNDGGRIHTKYHPEIVVLHFHAQDKQEWLSVLDRRATRGAYRTNVMLATFAVEANAEELDHFYEYTQTATPRMLAALAEAGLLIEAELGLRDKVAELF